MAGIGGLSFGMVGTPSLSMSQSEVRETKASSNAAVDDFLAYMKKSLAERMADAWLAAHGLDRDKLKAMKPDERDAVLKQMAEELKQQLQQAASEKKTGRKTDSGEGSAAA
jgi:acyl-CoA reductase-like NAD-dependent aldehyde dehydrogenase